MLSSPSVSFSPNVLVYPRILWVGVCLLRVVGGVVSVCSVLCSGLGSWVSGGWATRAGVSYG